MIMRMPQGLIHLTHKRTSSFLLHHTFPFLCEELLFSDISLLFVPCFLLYLLLLLTPTLSTLLELSMLHRCPIKEH